MNIYVGRYAGVYDGISSVSIAFAIKSNLSMVASTVTKYLGNLCDISLEGKKMVGEPWMGKFTKGKYVLSIEFDKSANLSESDTTPASVLIDNLMAMANIDNLAMEIEYRETRHVNRVDPQFWEKIKKVLMAIAAYGGVATEWTIYRQEIKKEHALEFTVWPHMLAEDADVFYEASIDYATKYEIPIGQQPEIYKDIEAYIQKCRDNNVCCICGALAFNKAVYPVCQDHYDIYLEIGKAAFELRYKL